MIVDIYTILRLVVYLLLLSWLIADLGIYWTSKQATRHDLPALERNRFLELTILMNMSSHTALILIPAVGFQLSHMAGFAVMSPSSLIFLWLSFAAWLSLIWLVYLIRHEPNIKGWLKFDLLVRIIVIVTMGSIGIVSLFTHFPVKSSWLATVFVLYAGAVMVSICSRAAIAAWRRGFPLIEQAETQSQGNAIIKSAHLKRERYTLVMWGFIIAIVLLGVMQPIWQQI